MITRRDVLLKWAKEWTTLKAWHRDLSEVEIEISNHQFPDRLGTCWPVQQRIKIYRAPMITDELDTLIHEMAHAVMIYDGHGEMWQGCYSAAIKEVTGITIPQVADNYHILCEAGRAAVASWWTRSGHEFLWKLVGSKEASVNP